MNRRRRRRRHKLKLPQGNELGFSTSLLCSGSAFGSLKGQKPVDRLVFCDMAHYTMVKNNMFNGVNLPSIAIFDEEEGIKIIRQFGYEDFKPVYPEKLVAMINITCG